MAVADLLVVLVVRPDAEVHGFILHEVGSHLEAVRIGFDGLAADTREAACAQYNRQRDAYNLAWPRDLLEPLRTVWPFSPEANRCIPNVHATPPRA